MCSYDFSSVLVAEWPSFGKELLTRLTICSLCILTICNFSYFPFWLDLCSNLFRSWSSSDNLRLGLVQSAVGPLRSPDIF